MSRKPWLWAAAVLIAAALAATFFFAPKTPDLLAPVPTPFGWSAQLRPVAGDGVRGMRNGPVAQARFDDPYGVAVANEGTQYVADAGDNNRIRRIGTDGAVTTLAGFSEGFADGEGTAARLNTPSGLALDRAGNLYVADTGNHAIRKITPLGMVSTVAGTGVAGFRDGARTQAQFNGPIGVAADAHGNIYVADTYNDRIRRIGRDGTLSRLGLQRTSATRRRTQSFKPQAGPQGRRPDLRRRRCGGIRAWAERARDGIAGHGGDAPGGGLDGRDVRQRAVAPSWRHARYGETWLAGGSGCGVGRSDVKYSRAPSRSDGHEGRHHRPGPVLERCATVSPSGIRR